jgi:anti-sigma regulatory factor (Ser/Thr protein kinase)
MQTASSCDQGLQPPAPATPLLLWPAQERSVRKGRRRLTDTLVEWKLDELTDTACLVLSELMTNAVQHGRPSHGGLAGSEIGTRFFRLENAVRIEVHDVSAHTPQVRTSDPDALDEGGRGLLLVDALTCGQWGVGTRDGIGKLVWATVSAVGAGGR